MYKSIFLFLGGTVFGAAVVAFVLSPASVDDNRAFRSLSGYKSASTAGQAESAEKYASLAPAPRANSNLNYNASTAARPNSSASQLPPLLGAMPVPATAAVNVVQQTRESLPPTTEQVEQFRTMQINLHGAAYNPSAVLADLTKQSDKLTPEQRQKLADEAMEMIKRGELKAEQFMPQPGS